VISSVVATIDVRLKNNAYPIRIGPGLLTNQNAFSDAIGGKDVMIVSDVNVAPLYLAQLTETLAPWQPESLVLPAGEEQKTLDTLSKIFDRLADCSFNRDATVVALGGGVIGDLAGFAAACYQRGIAFLQVPTTLLAQVDASVGGKTAVNHRMGKNLLGAFHQPRAVVVDVCCLDTLDVRQYRSGLAEVVKYGAGLDADFFAWLESNMAALVDRQADVLTETIKRCCAIKAAIVAEDEFEAGRRALLNLGHTFAHAIEVASGYGEWLHGEAVSVGLIMAARLSEELGRLDHASTERIINLLRSAGLPVTPPAIGVVRMEQLMGMDKKVAAGRKRFVVLDSLGTAMLTDEVPGDSLRKVLGESFADDR